VNLVLNALLIPLFGAAGAATATATAFVAQAPLLLLFVHAARV
jgi:O-antigen/teichoic acid export membrane protein